MLVAVPIVKVFPVIVEPVAEVAVVGVNVTLLPAVIPSLAETVNDVAAVAVAVTVTEGLTLAQTFANTKSLKYALLLI